MIPIGDRRVGQIDEGCVVSCDIAMPGAAVMAMESKKRAEGFILFGRIILDSFVRFDINCLYVCWLYYFARC